MTMGVALKRRDNAPIVKDIFGGALDILMEKRDIKAAQKFVQDMLVQVMQNKIPLDKFVITKQLRDDYAAMKKDYDGPATIPAHRVLADRMEARDKGTAPQVGDRIPYIYISTRKDEKKQGDRIEHYDYVKEKNLKPDVEFYITNQLQTPLSQLFVLRIDDVEGYDKSRNRHYEKIYQDALTKFNNDEEEAMLFTLKKKECELESIMFMKSDHIQRALGNPIQQKLNSYFTKK
jgi:DNA polymerase elongation subunit (family B)